MKDVVWSDVVLTFEPMTMDLHVLQLCDSLEFPWLCDQKPVVCPWRSLKDLVESNWFVMMTHSHQSLSRLISSARMGAHLSLALQRPPGLWCLPPAGKVLPRGPALQPVLDEALLEPGSVYVLPLASALLHPWVLCKLSTQALHECSAHFCCQYLLWTVCVHVHLVQRVYPAHLHLWRFPTVVCCRERDLAQGVLAEYWCLQMLTLLSKAPTCREPVGESKIVFWIGQTERGNALDSYWEITQNETIHEG